MLLFYTNSNNKHKGIKLKNYLDIIDNNIYNGLTFLVGIVFYFILYIYITKNIINYKFNNQQICRASYSMLLLKQINDNEINNITTNNSNNLFHLNNNNTVCIINNKNKNIYFIDKNDNKTILNKLKYKIFHKKLYIEREFADEDNNKKRVMVVYERDTL